MRDTTSLNSKLFTLFGLLFFVLSTALAQDAPATDDPATNYKAALALVNAGKGTEGIPYLEKVLKTQTAYTPAAYSLLGGIYDNDHQTDKAISIYSDGLKAYPKEQILYYNLGLAYSRKGFYNNAETAAIEAIKLDPKHAGSQRMYALVEFHQNRRVNALLGFCSFLLLEPNTPRSAEAITNMQSILRGGALKESSGLVITGGFDVQENKTLNAGLTNITTSAQAKKLTGATLLEYELKAIFTLAGQQAEKKADKNFYDNFYAAYFYKLAQSPNMPAFAKLVADKEMGTGLADWVKGTERGF